jgi:hypothetical protein
MTYICSKRLFDMIATEVTNRELTDSKLTIYGFICEYFSKALNLPTGSITKIETIDA